jgi:hypothetical protein
LLHKVSDYNTIHNLLINGLDLLIASNSGIIAISKSKPFESICLLLDYTNPILLNKPDNFGCIPLEYQKDSKIVKEFLIRGSTYDFFNKFRPNQLNKNLYQTIKYWICLKNAINKRRLRKFCNRFRLFGKLNTVNFELKLLQKGYHLKNLMVDNYI